ncbi:SDR family NAD(P)-dependent oxidoreductase [Streptomyces sp. BBFR51]|uniref:SDR family NAD(P)-dependent oxidoreductase n=1 Tax=Streptomyces sp. BBFR51 TaxID=3372856 RepID=UPI0037DC4B39
MNRTAVVTGGAGGLGLVTARHLVEEGMDVVLVGRDRARTAAAVEAVYGPARRGAPTAPGRVYTADLSRWSQVRHLASELAADGVRVDVLINNAGAAYPRYEQTPDGVERTHAINHVAPFLLTHTLLAAGAFAEHARIVNIASSVARRGGLDPREPDVTGTSRGGRRYSQLHVYGTSKLVGLLATMELARRLPVGMRAYNADPGMVKNGFNTNSGGLMRLTGPLFRPFAITPDEGVRPACSLATARTAPEPNGGYFTGAGPVAPPSRLSREPALARGVYEATASLLGVEPLPVRERA